MEEAKRIGNNLREARKAAGFTQKQVADFMLMSQQQYSRFENGVYELNYGQIIKLCKLYDISESDLFGI